MSRSVPSEATAQTGGRKDLGSLFALATLLVICFAGFLGTWMSLFGKELGMTKDVSKRSLRPEGSDSLSRGTEAPLH